MNLHLKSLAAAAILWGASSIHGASYTYSLDSVYTGTEPGGSGAYLTASFSDITVPPGATSAVQLTLSSSGLVDREIVTKWLFNLNPDLNPSSLSFNLVSQSGSASTPSISVGGSNAGGGITMDIQFAMAPGGDDEFGAGSTFVFEITGQSLDASDFNYVSTSASGSFYSVAHIQRIGDNSESAWIGDAASRVPEPGTWAVLSSLLFLVLGAKTHKKGHQNQLPSE